VNDSITPVVRCPKSDCGHPIDEHVGDIADLIPTIPKRCIRCTCRMTPNLIAVAALFGDLTNTEPSRISRQPDGSWS
jgi:hypothetical protein